MIECPIVALGLVGDSCVHQVQIRGTSLRGLALDHNVVVLVKICTPIGRPGHVLGPTAPTLCRLQINTVDYVPEILVAGNSGGICFPVAISNKLIGPAVLEIPKGQVISGALAVNFCKFLGTQIALGLCQDRPGVFVYKLRIIDRSFLRAFVNIIPTHISGVKKLHFMRLVMSRIHPMQLSLPPSDLERSIPIISNLFQTCILESQTLRRPVPDATFALTLSGALPLP